MKNSINGRISRCFALVTFCAAVSSFGLAQTAGIPQGAVSDPSGAVVSNAKSYDFHEWLPELKGTTLFQDVEGEQLVALLEAMHPKVIRLKKGDLFPPEFTPGHFMVILRSNSKKELAPRRFKWDMPQFGEPGFIMAEIPSLSRYQERLSKQYPPVFKRTPLTEDCDLLEMTGEMLTAQYSDNVSLAQRTVLRNLLGMMAQKVMDVRRDLYKTKFGVDIYNMKEGDREKMAQGHAGH
jgi:hypothetical protein